MLDTIPLSDESQTIKIDPNLLLLNECTVCNENYYTPAYGGDLEYCDRCKIMGDTFLREIKLAQLFFEQRLNIILTKWRRIVLEKEEVPTEV